MQTYILHYKYSWFGRRGKLHWKEEKHTFQMPDKANAALYVLGYIDLLKPVIFLSLEELNPCGV